MEGDALPRWVQVIAGVVGVLATTAGTAVGAYYLFRGKRRADAKEEQDLADERAAKDGERAAAVKREALAEAWATVDRQNARLEDQEQEIRELRAQITRCEADRAALKVIAAWARTKGMKVTPEIEELMRGGARPPEPPHEPHGENA